MEDYSTCAQCGTTVADINNVLCTDCENEGSTQRQFNELVKPLIKFMAQEVHPHHTLIITSTSAELLEGEMVFSTKEFIQD